MAIRKHVLITHHPDLPNRLEILEGKIQQFNTTSSQTQGFKENIQIYKEYVDRHENELMYHKIELVKELIANNQKLIDETLDHIVNYKDGKSTDQLKAQMICHQICAPLKIIQSLLSVKMIQNDNDNLEEMLQSLSKEIQYKSIPFKEFLQDFDDILKQNTAIEFITIRSIIANLTIEVDKLLSENNHGNQSENVEIMVNVLFNEWPNLVNAIDFMKFHIEIQTSQGNSVDEALNKHLNRMLDLMKCTEMGVDTYQYCRNDFNTMTMVHARVDDFKMQIKMWKAYEQSMYKKIVPMLKAIEDGSAWDPVVVENIYIPFLVDVDSILGQMQQQPSIGNDLEYVFRNARHAIEMISRLFYNKQVLNDRKTVVAITEHIQRPIENVDTEKQEKMEILNDIIASNWMLEICMIARETLKMEVLPFKQYKLELGIQIGNTTVNTLKMSFLRIFVR